MTSTLTAIEMTLWALQTLHITEKKDDRKKNWKNSLQTYQQSDDKLFFFYNGWVPWGPLTQKAPPIQFIYFVVIRLCVKKLINI